MMPLRDVEVHLWLADLQHFAAPQRLAACEELLDGAEHERARRFAFARHQQRLIITRGLLRSLLSLYHVNTAPQEWQFSFNPHGKPALAAPELDHALQFNLSHSGRRLVIAISKLSLLGVDIEMIMPRQHLMAIARRHFSADEYQALTALDGDRRIQRFYDLWTLKESYVKACGKGLAIQLKEFSFAFPSPGQLDLQFSVQREDDVTRWYFAQFADAESRMALAVSRPKDNARPRLLIRSLQDLGQFTTTTLMPAGEFP